MSNIVKGYEGAVLMDSTIGTSLAPSTGYVNAVQVAEINSFTLNMSADTFETTEFGDTNKEYEYGTKGGTLSFSGSLASTELGSSEGQGAIQHMYLASNSLRKPWFRLQLSTAAADKVFRGTVTGYSIGANVNDKQTFSAEVQLSGGIQTT